MNTQLYRIWVGIEDDDRFNEVTKGFNKQNTYIEAVIPSVLIQYDILLTQEELLLLTLCFGPLEALSIEKDVYNNVVYVISDQE